MTKFKANMIFAICLYLLGDTFLDGQMGQELSENAIDATMQWGVMLMGYGLVLTGCAIAFWTGINKMAGKL